jgi:P27 family predicted phage terminase small subunit
LTKSAFHKTLSGTVRRDRNKGLRHGDPLGSVPPSPPNLSPAARRAWERLGGLTVEAGTLTRYDTELLALAARTTATCEELETQLAADGVLLHSKGAIKAHPACAALDRSRSLLLKMLDSLGLSPAGRERLPTKTPGVVGNKFAQLK